MKPISILILQLLFSCSILFGQRSASQSFHTAGSVNDTNLEEKLADLTQLEKDQNLKVYAELSYQIGMHYLMKGDYNRFFHYMDHSIEKATAVNAYLVWAEALGAKAETFSMLEKHYDSLKYFLKALDVCLQANNHLGAAQNQASISSSYRELGILDSAKIYIDQALKYQPKANEQYEYSIVYQMAGAIYREVGEFDDAYGYMMEALKIFEEQDLTYQRIVTLNSIGVLLGDQGEMEKSEIFVRKSLDLARKNDVLLYQANPLLALGEFMYQRSQLDSAYYYLESALEIYLQKNKTLAAADVQLRIGKVDLKNNQPSKGLQKLEDALKVFEQQELQSDIVAAKLLIGKAHLELNQTEKALDYLIESKTLAETINLKLQLDEIYLQLTNAYTQTNNYKKAYQTHLKYTTLMDSLHDLEKNKIIRELESQYELAKKEDNIEQLEQSTKTQTAQLRNQNNAIIALIFGISIFLLLSIALYRNLSYTKLITKQTEEINRHKIQELEKDKRLSIMQAMIKGQEQERRRVAQDLHDGLGGLLSTVKLKFDAAKEAPFAFSTSKAYQEGNELLDLACREVRKISHNMMPGAIAKFGLIPAVNDMCLALEKAQNIKVDFQTINWTRKLPEDLSITIYRIIQELLNNVVKHAEATEVIVQLACHDQSVNLVVEDNGRGFVPAQRKQSNGLGISSVQSRVDYLNGKLDIESLPGKGTTFCIDFPLKEGIDSPTT